MFRARTSCVGSWYVMLHCTPFWLLLFSCKVAVPPSTGLEVAARYFASFMEFVMLGLRHGWEVARPEVARCWTDFEPVLDSVDFALSCLRPWQVLANWSGLALRGTCTE